MDTLREEKGTSDLDSCLFGESRLAGQGGRHSHFDPMVDEAEGCFSQSMGQAEAPKVNSDYGASCAVQLPDLLDLSPIGVMGPVVMPALDLAILGMWDVGLTSQQSEDSAIAAVMVTAEDKAIRPVVDEGPVAALDTQLLGPTLVVEDWPTLRLSPPGEGGPVAQVPSAELVVVLPVVGVQNAELMTTGNDSGAAGISASDQGEALHLEDAHSVHVATQPAEGTFVASLKKSIPTPLLLTPEAAPRRTSIASKEAQTDLKSQRKSRRLANRPKSNLTMEEQATMLLMKKCGTLAEVGTVSKEDQAKFREEFVEPLKTVSVSGYRDMFGLSVVDGSNPLSALAVEAET